MSIVDELVAVLGYEIRGEDQARRFNERLNSLERGLDSFAVNAGRAAGAAGVLLTGAFGLLGRSVVDVNAKFEVYEETLTTIEGSADKAAESLLWVSDFAKSTPYDIDQLTTSFVALKAYGIDPIADDALRTLGDTAAAMGKPLQQAVEAFADASTFEFERLKEFGIRAAQQGDEVTFSWTKNGEQLTQVVKKNSTDVRQFLLETMGDRFAGAMDRQSRTWVGMMSNLGDTWTDFRLRIGNAGFFDKMTGNLQGVLDWLKVLDADGTLDRWAQNLSNVLSTMVDVFGNVAGRFGKHIPFIIEHFESLKKPLAVIGTAFALMIARAFPLITFFTVAAFTIDEFLTYLQGGESIIGDFIEWLQNLTGMSEGVAEKIALMTAATAALVLMAGPVRTLGLAFRALGAGIGVATAAAGVKSLGGLGKAGFALAARLGIIAGGAALLAGGGATRVDAESSSRGDATGLYDWFRGGDSSRPVGAADPADPYREYGRSRQEDSDARNFDYRDGYSNSQAPTMSEGMKKMFATLDTMQANIDSRSGSTAGLDATLNDNRQDNRQFPQTNNVTVNQTVTKATDAPGAAADATGAAILAGQNDLRTQVEQEPSF